MPRSKPAQQTLFDRPEADPRAVRIRPASKSAALGKRQKRFNNLVDKISRQNRKLQRWQEFLPELAQRIESDLQPQLNDMLALQRSTALRLGELLDQQRKPRPVANTYRQRVRAWMVELSDEVLTHGGPDPELEALRLRHEIPYDAMTCMEHAIALRIAAADMFGRELIDDIDADSGDELLKELERRLATTEDSEHEESGGAACFDHENPAEPEAEGKARGPARGSKAGSKTDTKSTDPLRSVFRRLASRLHPDRETNPEIRTEKTALMQRANDAHERRDLLELLRLQLELEQIDPEQLAEMPEADLEGFIAELQLQARKLDDEIEDLIGHLRGYIPIGGSLTPDHLEGSLERDVARTKVTCRELEQTLAYLEQPKTRRGLFAQLPEPEPYAQEDADFQRLVRKLADLVDTYAGRPPGW